MTRAEQRIAALEQQVERLTAELEWVKYDACTLKTFEQWEELRRFAASRPAAPSRPRHLAAGRRRYLMNAALIALVLTVATPHVTPQPHQGGRHA